MISNQILQNTIDGLKGITRVDLCIIDTEGKVLATTFPDADKYIGPAVAFVESPADSQVVQGCQFFKVFDEHQPAFHGFCLFKAHFLGKFHHPCT